MPYNFANVLITFVCGIMLYNQMLTNHETNGSIYQHVDLVPVSRAQLLNYPSLSKEIAVERFITNAVDGLYVDVLKNAATGKPGYWYKLSTYKGTIIVRKAVPEIVIRVKKLFPGCTVETSGDKMAVLVYWGTYVNNTKMIEQDGL